MGLHFEMSYILPDLQTGTTTASFHMSRNKPYFKMLFNVIVIKHLGGGRGASPPSQRVCHSEQQIEAVSYFAYRL